jgi:hypothetical protein
MTAKMLTRISDLVHPKIATETIKIGDAFSTLQITTVPVKFRLASVAITITTNTTVTARVVTSGITIEMHQVKVDKVIGLGTHGHITCHPKIF